MSKEPYLRWHPIVGDTGTMRGEGFEALNARTMDYLHEKAKGEAMPEKPEWQDAKSSMKFGFRFVDEKVVDGVGFGRLGVRWQDGRTGAYIDVNRRTYDEFVSSPSRGKFLNQVLKPGFTYVRGEDEKKASEEAPDPEAA